LELARLAARRNDRAKAVEFYRASIYGTWEGDGVVRRAAVRQELASYLISEKEYAPARLELLISAGNSPESADLDLTLAGLLDEAQDPSDAWVYLRKATTMAPHDAHVLETAGRYAYARGDYDEASRLLDRAEDAATSAHTQLSAETQQMRSDAERISQLIPVTGASQREDAAHAIAARTIARKRLDICLANSSLPAAGQVQLAALAARWKGPEGTASVAELRDPDIRGQTMGLVYTTETVSAQACGAPNGDDALLLQAAERMAAADKQVQP
jgi:tetratricopeptide (TPR) repeat protein